MVGRRRMIFSTLTFFTIASVVISVAAYPQKTLNALGSTTINATNQTNNDLSNASLTMQKDHQQNDVSQLVERAIQNGELLGLNEWTTGSNVNTSTNQNAQSATVTEQERSPRSGQRYLEKRQSTVSTSVDTMQADGMFVFPSDDITVNQRDKFTPRLVPVCEGSTFCENIPNYPEDAINSVIRQNKSLKYLASVDSVTVIQRIDAMDDTPLCVATEQLVFPKSAENKRKEWLFVVNQDNFKQGVRIETCSNEDSDCSIIDGTAEGYKTTCKQKYIYRQLAAISEDGSVSPEMFRFPSSCCCHAKFVGSPLSRMGVIGTQKNRAKHT